MTRLEARAILMVNTGISVMPYARVRRTLNPDESSAWDSLVAEAQKTLDHSARGVLPL